MRLARVLEVEREVGVGEVRTLLHQGEELAGEDVRDSDAKVHMAVDLIPGVGVRFLADVVAGSPRALRTIEPPEVL